MQKKTKCYEQESAGQEATINTGHCRLYNSRSQKVAGYTLTEIREKKVFRKCERNKCKT